MSTYRYTAKDGEQITGTLQEIGDQIIEWHGDRATQDNPEPWLTIDEHGAETDRAHTAEEFIAWLSRAEDRTEKHVARDLVELADLTNSPLREWLGDTEVTAAQLEALEAAAEDADRFYPGEDNKEERSEYLSAAAEIILGDTTIQDAMSAYGDALLAFDWAKNRRRAQIRAAYALGLATTYQLERVMGIPSATVQKDIKA